MQKKDATERFQLTKQLFDAGRYTEALDILNALDETFPDTKNIMYPRALCLARLGRVNEALDISQKLVVRFGDKRAQSLLDKLTGAPPDAAPPRQPVQPPRPPQMPVSLAGLEALDRQAAPGSVPQIQDVSNLFAIEEEAAQAMPLGPPPRRLGPIIGGVVAAVAVVGVVAVSLFLLFRERTPSSGSEAAAPAPPTPAVEKDAQTPTAPPGTLAWYTDYPQGMQVRTVTKAPALLFFTDGSNGCELMEQQVFSEPSIIQLLTGWVLIKVNGQTQPDACSFHNVGEFPTTVILDGTGMAVLHETGNLAARELYDNLIVLNLKPGAAPKFTTMIVMLVAVVLVSLLNLPLYFTLRIVSKLPYETLFENMLSIVGMSIVFALCNCIPLIGFFVGIYVLTKKYEMGFVDWLIYLGLQVAYAIVVFVALFAAMGVDLASAFSAVG